MNVERLTAIKELTHSYLNYKEERISLIASENRSSDLLLSSYLLGLCDQYCSRLPSERYGIDNLAFGNIDPLDNINDYTRNLVNEMFGSADCDIRLLSGLNGFTVLLFALLNEGDTLFKMHDLHGGHLSVKPIAKRLNINIYEMRLGNNYTLDLNDFETSYNAIKPRVIFLDSSYSLFPYPLKEIRQIIDKNTVLVYDASHVIALIAGKQYQDPFAEGADIVHSTTHKTMWGPQKSMILLKDRTTLVPKVHDIVKNVLVSNTHLHHIFGLLIALVELQEFGVEYAKALIENNKYFAECLDRAGFKVLGRNYGYTETNQFWINCDTKKQAIEVFKKLQDINISSNMIFLPGDLWGLRIGTNDLTRSGANKNTFEILSSIMADAIYGKDSNESLKARCSELKSGLRSTSFSFDHTEVGNELINLFTNKIGRTVL